MKRIILLAMFLCSLGARGQTTAVTATLTDTDGTLWVSGTCSVTLQWSTTKYPTTTPYRKDLGPSVLVPQHPPCSVDASGVMTTTVTDVAFVYPPNSTWLFSVCPNVYQGNQGCSVTQVPVTGPNMDLTGVLRVQAPRVGGGIGAFAYADVEVAPLWNNFYQNTILGQCRQWNNSWQQCNNGGGGGGGPPTGAAGGILSGTYPNPNLASAGALPNGWGAATQVPGENTSLVATDAFVQAAVASVPVQTFANGMAATTQAANDNSTSIATDAFVGTAIAGIGGLLPSAPGYGYAPISNGVGNVYSPQTVILGFGSNGVQYVQQPLGSGFFPSLNVNLFEKVFYVDGFSSYGGIGQSVVAWASGPNYAQCRVVSNGGNFYINLNNGTSGSVTPGTNSGVWWPVPNNLPATNADCAGATAESYVLNQHINALVQFGSGYYTTNQGFKDPIDGNSFDDQFSVSYAGPCDKCTYLSYTGTAGVIMFNRPAGGGNYTSKTMHDMSINGGGLASANFEFGTLGQSYFYNMTVGHVQAGAHYFAEFGRFGGDAFQVFRNNINWSIFPDSGTQNCANVTANVSGGAVTGFTVNAGGACYNSSYTGLSVTALQGYKGGTSNQPCTVMPSGGMVPSFTGNALTSISAPTSGGSGCSGTIDVQVYQTPNVDYAEKSFTSDSSDTDSIAYAGSIAPFYNGAGDMIWRHAHPSVTFNGIYDPVGGGVYEGTELDDIGGCGFNIPGTFATQAVAITGTQNYIGSTTTSRLLPGSAIYCVGATSSVNIAASGPLCQACNPSNPTDFQIFVTPSGPIQTKADWTTKAHDLNVTGNDRSAGEVMGDYEEDLTVSNFQSATLKGNTVNGLAQGTATAGGNFGSAGSPGFGPCGSYWNGSAATSTCAIEQLNVGAGTNPALQTQFSMFPCPAGGCTWLFNQQILVQNLLDAYHFGSNTPSGPTLAAGTGAGGTPTGPSLVSFGSDLSGYVTLTTGSAPVASAIVFTLTFNQPYLFNGPKCNLWGSNAAAAALSGTSLVQFLRADNTTTTVAARAGSTALTAATAYEWGYTCTQ